MNVNCPRSEIKFQLNREVTWTTLELTGLLEDEESHVHFTRTTKHLALHPYHLNNVQRGLNQILRSSLNSYDRELKGFVLAFRNPKLLSNLGEMLYDSPFIHIDIEADFYLFRPTVGSFLKGVVNKKGLDHIVVLVHKIYTVSIPKPDDAEEWPGGSMEIGQEVKCCVNHIDNKSKPPFICATLKSDYSQGCRLSESTNNIDNMDSAIGSMNSTMKIDVSANGILEDDGVSEKERKKHRKKHKKSRDNKSEFVFKVENESESNDNTGSDTSRTIKSEKKQQYQSMQNAVLNTDNSLNNSEVDNVPKKKSKKASKSLLDSNTVLDEHTESRKAVKRENTVLDEHTESRKAVKRESSIPLDDITETETKKRKKHAKKSRESDTEFVFTTENEEKIVNSTGNATSKCIKSEKEEQHKMHIVSNADLSSSNLEDSVSKKHKKNKKSSMKMSDSESKDHVVKIKIEKQDTFTDRITNEKSEMSKFIKKEDSIKYDYTSDKERKKSPKKHTITSRDSQSESVFKIKNEDDVTNDINNTSDKERKKSSKKHANMSRDSDSEIRIKNEDDVTSDINNTSDKERKKSPKKHANVSRDSDSEIRIKSENITNDVKDISRAIKYEREESPHMKYNTSATDSNTSKKKKTPIILTDSELEYPVKVKIEKV